MIAKPQLVLKAGLLAFLATLLLVFLVQAAPNTFSIPWWTVDGGGGSSEGGEYTVSGTIGQPDTSPLMSDGDYEVVGGFWGGSLVIPEGSNYLFLPITTK